MMDDSNPTPGAATPDMPQTEITLPYWELLFREIIAIEALAIVLVWIALVWNAPLEQLADPLHTPNPAKAPWYFTGLQELLHYFPPFVAGIILPTLVVIALVIIPFFKVNIQDEGLWVRRKSERLVVLGVVVAALTLLLARFHAWDALLPVWLTAFLMLLAASSASRSHRGFRSWLSAKPLSFWIMTWFLTEAAVLTAVGTSLRGPGWQLVWPWRP
jgi:hypothetical protein